MLWPCIRQQVCLQCRAEWLPFASCGCATPLERFDKIYLWMDMMSLVKKGQKNLLESLDRNGA